MKRRWLSPFAIVQVLMAVVIATAMWMAYWPWRWARVREEVRTRYSAVKQINGELLKRWMADRTVKPPLLLDVRTAAEYDFSHLPGAIRVVEGAPLADNLLTGKEDVQIVVYDAVGFDAGKFAVNLLQRNFKDVQTLEGGIFQWANDRLPLIGPGASESRLRLGSTEYRSLLDRARRAP